MIKPDQIPDAVADSMREFFHTRGDAQEAIAAALNAWPGMHTHEWQRPWLGGMSGSDIILLLPLATSLQKMQTTQSGDSCND